jgi:hypothetical protein
MAANDPACVGEALDVCREIVRRAAVGCGARAEYANGRGTLAGVSLDEKVVDAAVRVLTIRGEPAEVVIDRCTAPLE